MANRHRHKKLRAEVRTRMAKTGESYQTARERILARSTHTAVDLVPFQFFGVPMTLATAEGNALHSVAVLRHAPRSARIVPAPARDVAPAAGGELSAGAPLGDVSDTARWVAYFRALESARPDALFRDPLARRLAGDRGRAIAETLPIGPLSWSLAVRTRVFDELILDAVHGGVRVVLNLAAGLDARPYRLPPP